MEAPLISLVIPVYKNEPSIPQLLEELELLDDKLKGRIEIVFVVDGSPDNSYLLLQDALPKKRFQSQLLGLTRNFGSFAAIRAGLEAGKGDLFAVLAADLQEPPNLVAEFYMTLAKGDYDIALGKRESREDPLLSKTFSNIFWWLYKRLINPSVPDGGVDVFACSRAVRDQLLRLRENNSSLIGLLFWIGFRRVSAPYKRQKRVHGKSAWTFKRKLGYLLDSCISFTDLPIHLLVFSGVAGLLLSAIVATVVISAKFMGYIYVPGYTPIVLAIVFFGSLNCLGLGIIGGYVWRTFENTKSRPLFIVREQLTFTGRK